VVAVVVVGSSSSGGGGGGRHALTIINIQPHEMVVWYTYHIGIIFTPMSIPLPPSYSSSSYHYYYYYYYYHDVTAPFRIS